jgi:hypothetical protein
VSTRRAFIITLLGGAAASSVSWPFAARAQERVRRVGVLMLGDVRIGIGLEEGDAPRSLEMAQFAGRPLLIGVGLGVRHRIIDA